ncbi:MAG: lipoate--protein ligase family protein, partial [Anaerolineales bacterium]|nr:lipoate--protein ligase family protein [Anaerolineales bacterium]
LIDLGEVSSLRSQSIYHAIGYAMTDASPNTIILVSPNRPYVCIGFHQEVEKEIDLDYCRSHGLPVLRREVGGGAVYLDNGQVFTQWIFHPNCLPGRLEHLFELFIRPLVMTYQSLGVDAYFRPINDVHVAGKKIGGSGAALLGQAKVVVGSLMFDFDKASMARVLKVPSEKMRDKIFASLEQYMTSLAEQMDEVPSRIEVKNTYLHHCAEVLNAEIMPGALSSEEEAKITELEKRFNSEEWLFQKGGLLQRGVKIHEDVRVVEKVYKAPGGLIRVVVCFHQGLIDNLTISGDFTILPAHAVSSMEQAMRGIFPQFDRLVERLVEVYDSLKIQSPGVTPTHIAEVIVKAAEA